jgi:hypothetical protein
LTGLTLQQALPIVAPFTERDARTHPALIHPWVQPMGDGLALCAQPFSCDALIVARLAEPVPIGWVASNAVLVECDTLPDGTPLRASARKFAAPIATLPDPDGESVDITDAARAAVALARAQPKSKRNRNDVRQARITITDAVPRLYQTSMIWEARAVSAYYLASLPPIESAIFYAFSQAHVMRCQHPHGVTSYLTGVQRA